VSLRLRRGSPPTAPPPSVVYGPVPDRQYIRDHAGPLPVSNPGGGVPFSSASNIQTLINNNPSNTVFVASATGTYTNFRGIVYGNKHPRFYFPGNALTDYNITGAGTLNETALGGNTNGLEVYGGKWSGYGSAASAFNGSIVAEGGPSVIQDAFFTLAGRDGLTLLTTANGHSFTVNRCKFLDNGRYNFSHAAIDPFLGTPVIDSCLLDHGNSNNNDPGGDAACMKIGASDGGTVRNCHSKNNVGFGIWFDGSNRNARINNNVVENNIGIAPVPGAGGIFYEIGYGGAVIEHNYAIGNGSAGDANYPFNAVQIAVSCSPCDGTGFVAWAVLDLQSEIRYNEIDTSGFRTPIVLYNHTSHNDVLRTRKWYVHHNLMFQRGTSGQSRVGLSDQCSVGTPKEGDIGTSPTAPGFNLFDYNEYHVADISGSYWEHDTSSASPGARTWAQFQARGHETHGTVEAI
jgi:hypothetical protein